MIYDLTYWLSTRSMITFENIIKRIFEPVCFKPKMRFEVHHQIKSREYPKNFQTRLRVP